MPNLINAIIAALLSMAAYDSPDDSVTEFEPDSTTWISVTTVEELELCYTSQGEEVPWWAYLPGAIGDDMTCEIGDPEWN